MDHDVPLARRLTSHALQAMAATQIGEPKKATWDEAYDSHSRWQA